MSLVRKITLHFTGSPEQCENIADGGSIITSGSNVTHHDVCATPRQLDLLRANEV